MKCGDFRVHYQRDDGIFESNSSRVWLGIFLAFLLIFPHTSLASPYWLDVVNRILFYTVGAVGFNILVGFTGQISIGHAAFISIGAYTATLLGGGIELTDLSWSANPHITLPFTLPFWLCIPISGVVAAAIGMIFGLPSLRLKGFYLVMATFAAHFIWQFTTEHWLWLTNGNQGLLVPTPSLFGLEMDSDGSRYYLFLVVCVLAVWTGKNLFRTKVGRAFLAIRDQDISAQVMGVDLYAYKLLAFGISSFYAGVAGALMAYHTQIITPELFYIDLGIDYFVIIVIGGLGSTLGSVYGAIFIILFPEILAELSTVLGHGYPRLLTAFAYLRQFIFGLVIVLFLIFRPEGLADMWRKTKNYFTVWPFAY